MKRFVLSPLFFLLFFAVTTLYGSQFELFMGKGTRAWEHVRTVEDRGHLAFYEKLYLTNSPTDSGKVGGIPNSFHLIWLGPNPLPEDSLARLEELHVLYPDWDVYYWTDGECEPPSPWMVKRSVADFDFESVEEAFCFCDNFKEKAFVLGLEILNREGGVVLDHDVSVQQSFAKCHNQLDFYSALAPLRPSIFSSSVFISPYILAGKAGHPFFKGAMNWYRQNGKKYGHFFSGTTPAAAIFRTQQRMYEALKCGVKEGIGKKGYRDCLFPASEMSTYFVHLNQGVWKRMETVREAKLRDKIESIDDKLPFTMKLMWILIAMIPITWISLSRRKS